VNLHEERERGETMSLAVTDGEKSEGAADEDKEQRSASRVASGGAAASSSEHIPAADVCSLEIFCDFFIFKYEF
jgi:hypothetical protein